MPEAVTQPSLTPPSPEDIAEQKLSELLPEGISVHVEPDGTKQLLDQSGGLLTPQQVSEVLNNLGEEGESTAQIPVTENQSEELMTIAKWIEKYSAKTKLDNDLGMAA